MNNGLTTSHLIRQPLLSTSLFALLVSLTYVFFLGYRRDYLGHFAAGYGGTLCAVAAALAAIPPAAYRRASAFVPLTCTIICVLAGAVAEATVFRLAKFDEIDFCNQSLGAVLAGCALTSLSDGNKPRDLTFTGVIVVGLVFLLVGNYFALT